jgi:hypothetical protein
VRRFSRYSITSNGYAKPKWKIQAIVLIDIFWPEGQVEHARP